MKNNGKVHDVGSLTVYWNISEMAYYFIAVHVYYAKVL